MKSLDVDYIIGIHFPYIIRQKVLDVPKIGFLNLHPAYLPFNRGWHTPSWAILEGTPAGATLHFMSSDLDLGDIIAQEKVVIGPDDTANTLYRKLKSKERELFRASIPMITSLQPKRIPQKASEGTSHKSKELYNHSSREIKMDAIYQGQDLLKIIRGFTTNDFKEAAYFEEDGMKYYLQLTITPEIE
jgi:methionyl-tRNA formyltransferase